MKPNSPTMPGALGSARSHWEFFSAYRDIVPFHTFQSPFYPRISTKSCEIACGCFPSSSQKLRVIGTQLPPLWPTGSFTDCLFPSRMPNQKTLTSSRAEEPALFFWL